MPKNKLKELEEAIEDTQIIERTDIEMEDAEPKDEDGPDQVLIDLPTEAIERLTDGVFRLFESLKADRKENDDKWDNFEAQYEGSMEENSLMEFNLNVPVTMDKCNSVERLALQAFLESDPKFTSRLRPEHMKKGMKDDEIEAVQQKQEDYLDYQLDERINIASPLRQVLHQSTVLEGGLMKVPYEFKRKRRTRMEFYSGKRVMDEEVGLERAEGLPEFLRNYPKAALPGREGNKYYNQLMKFEDANFEGTYWEVKYDDAAPKFVDMKDFYVRKSCEGYAGLEEEQIKIERERFTFWELQALERAEKMINTDDMKFATAEEAKALNVDEEYDLKEHDVLTIDYYFKLDEGDEDETRLICWFGEHNKVFLGAILYPYHTVDSIYVPFYIKDKKKGFYKGGMAEVLTDSNIAQNAILNMMLTESWLQLINTPVVREGSEVADQILSGRWGPGVPLVVDAEVESVAEDITYLNKSTTGVANQMINVLLFLSRMDDDRTGINAGLSGKESPTDPEAPAAKTAMLLKQSGINVKEYINCLLPSFNKVGEIILQLTYQMSNSSRRFRNNRMRAVVGGDAFGEISRDEMILQSVIESRASSFDFDKINEKRENLALYQILRQEPIVAQNPKAVHEMVRMLLKSWSPSWKAKADKLVLTNEEFNAELTTLGVQALVQYMKTVKAKEETTGVKAPVDIQEYLGMAYEMINQVINPQKEEKK